MCYYISGNSDFGKLMYWIFEKDNAHKKAYFFIYTGFFRDISCHAMISGSSGLILNHNKAETSRHPAIM